MEEVIKKAIEGGFTETENLTDERDWWVFMREDFWKSLQRACKWQPVRFPPQKAYSDKAWLLHAQNFHHISLTKGINNAIEYLLNTLELPK